MNLILQALHDIPYTQIEHLTQLSNAARIEHIATHAYRLIEAKPHGDIAAYCFEHQIDYGLTRILVLIEHQVHLVGDRHLDAGALGEFANRRGVPNTFRHLAHTSEHRFEGFAPSQAQAHLPIAGEFPGAREYEVPEPGEPGERRSIRPKLDRQSRDLRQTPGDEGGTGI